MNSNQENKLSMYLKVRAFFLRRLAIYAALIPILAAKVTLLNVLIDRFMLHEAVASDDITGIAAAKRTHRDSLREKTLQACGALMAWATDFDQLQLRNKFDITITKLMVMRDTEELVFFQQVQPVMTANLVQLNNYGITAAFVDDYIDMLNEYAPLVELPGEYKASKVSAGLKVDALIAEIDALFKNTLDPLMETTRSSAEVEYNEYQNVRLIDDNAAGIGTPDILLTLPPNSYTVAATFPYENSRSFKVNNKGATALTWGLSTDALSFNNGTHTIPANSISTKQSGTLGLIGDKLLFYNPSASPVDIEVTVIE